MKTSLYPPNLPEQGRQEVLVYFPSSSLLDRIELLTPDPFHQELADKVRTSGILIRPRKRGYYFGESVEVEVHGLDGGMLGTERFAIAISPGSGFAGQVYRAIPERGVVFDASNAKHPLALKVLRPKSRWREAFRDILFKLSYQTSFAPRLREEALRAGLIWQELLRTAAGIEFGTHSVIAKPFGYYWDDDVSSFVEIHEWVNGRGLRHEADDQIITRWIGKTEELPTSEVFRKRKFMAGLVKLCYEIGAIGLALQYEWYTFVSQANVLTRNEQQDGRSEFVAVDCRPGLAVPFFLPLSPGHAKIILSGLRRGVFAHFDEVDFDKLDTYLAAHVNEFAHADGLIQQLKEDDARYRAGLPNVWHVGARLLRDKNLRQRVQEESIRDWQRLGKVSEEENQKLRSDSRRYVPYLILDNIPFVGQPLLRLLGSEQYREHIRRILRSPAYLTEVLEIQKASTVLEWDEGHRITRERAVALTNSTPRYLLEKLILGWQPKRVHRLAIDAQARRKFIENVVIHPVRLCVNREYREAWLLDIIERQAAKGVVAPEQVEMLREQVREARMQGFMRDLGFAAGFEAASKILYVMLAAYAFSAKDFLPLAVAVLGPISPSGVARAAYVLAQLVHNLPHIIKNKDRKLFLTRALGTVSAPWRVVGNVFAPLEMFAYYNDMSLLLGDYYVSKIVNAIPVFGGEGKLLEHWAFQASYNLPISARRAVSEVVSDK